MNIAELITLVNNKLTNLSQLRSSAERLGDIAQLAQLELQLNETQATLAGLKSLES